MSASVSPPELRLNGTGDEIAYMMNLIEHIIRECPRRLATTDSERRALDIMEAELRRTGLPTSFEPFEFNDSLYKNIALHFGLGTAASLMGRRAPGIAALLHLLVALSYWADSTRRGYLLRRLLRFAPSRNLLAVAEAGEEHAERPRLRVVLLAHIDAAYTGLMFEPEAIRRSINNKLPDNLRFLDRIMGVATYAQGALGVIGLTRLLSGRRLHHLYALEALLAVPAVGAFLLNLDVVLRDHVVPGANDNLTGCAALPVLANRLLRDKPDDVELVFAISGAEEASLGGADAMARRKIEEWDPANTIVIAVDTLSGGDIRFVEKEGEIAPRSIDPELRHAIQRVARRDKRFRKVHGLDIPLGASDALAFLHRGYRAVAVSCVDPEIGAPRNYHHPTDVPENIDQGRFIESVDFIDQLVRELWQG